MPPASVAAASAHLRACSVTVALCTPVLMAFCWLRNTSVSPSGLKRGENALPRWLVSSAEAAAPGARAGAGCGHATARRSQGRLKQNTTPRR